MSKIEIDLPPALAAFVEAQVEAGLFHSAAGVVEDAGRRASEEIWPPQGPELDVLRAAIAEGLADIEAGRVSECTIEEIIAEARAAASRVLRDAR